MWVTGRDSAQVLVTGKGVGLERQDCGLYPFCAGSLTGLGSSAEHRSPGVERADPPGPSSLPIVRHRWSASTSFVLAALRALHVDPSYEVTKSAMIEEGTSSPWTWRFARNLSNTYFRTRELRPWIPQSTHIHASSYRRFGLYSDVFVQVISFLRLMQRSGSCRCLAAVKVAASVELS